MMNKLILKNYRASYNSKKKNWNLKLSDNIFHLIIQQFFTYEDQRVKKTCEVKDRPFTKQKHCK